jgi:mandelate racemase
MTASIEITGIRVRPLLVPVRRPLRVSFGLFAEAPLLAIELETRGGIPGRVLAFTFHKLGMRLVPPALEALAGFAAGRQLSFAAMRAFHDECQRSLMLLGHEGVTQLALSMFDMAVHDALARAAGVPLFRLLGAERGELPVYNSCGGSIVPPPEAAREARELVAEHGGFRHIKVRLSRAHIEEDLAAVRAVRDAVGPDIAVSIDFNQALPSAKALDACRVIDREGLAWIEEPVAYDDYETQCRLTSKLATPVQVGETWWHWRVAKRAIEMRACDYIMPDVLRIGGVTGWMRVAEVAASAGIPFSSHLSPEYSAHLLAATPTRHWLEYMDWGQDVLLAPAVPRAGRLSPSDAPGAGVDFDEKAIARHIVRV